MFCGLPPKADVQLWLRAYEYTPEPGSSPANEKPGGAGARAGLSRVVSSARTLEEFALVSGAGRLHRLAGHADDAAAA
jgi:hypothetical protein